MLDLLNEVGVLGCKAWGALINSNSKLSLDQEELLEDPGRYIWLVAKLIYLTVTRLDISFAVNVVSQFLFTSRRAIGVQQHKYLGNLKAKNCIPIRLWAYSKRWLFYCWL